VRRNGRLHDFVRRSSLNGNGWRDDSRLRHNRRQRCRRNIGGRDTGYLCWRPRRRIPHSRRIDGGRANHDRSDNSTDNHLAVIRLRISDRRGLVSSHIVCRGIRVWYVADVDVTRLRHNLLGSS
jgi:hypothetical protein